MSDRARQQQRIVSLACAVVALHATLVLSASEPPPPLLPIAPADKVRAEPVARTASPGARAPIDKTGTIVVPRENCGTFWTQWGKDPKADSNPCPANCERGERLHARERKTDTGTQYQANYRCNLPELAIKQPPAALREPATPPRTNCGTFWTTKQSDPNSAANPCPEKCERGELLDVRRGRSGDKLYYEMNYRCYVAEPAMAPFTVNTPPMRMTGTYLATPGTAAAREPAMAPFTVNTPPMRMTGTYLATPGTAAAREPAMAPFTVNTPPMRMTGTYLAMPGTAAAREPAMAPFTVNTPPMRMTGTYLAMPGTAAAREPAMAPFTVNTPPMRMTGTYLAMPGTAAAREPAMAPFTVNTPPMRMTGTYLATPGTAAAREPAMAPFTVNTPPMRMTGTHVQTKVEVPRIDLVPESSKPVR